jgi:acyl carrier protein
MKTAEDLALEMAGARGNCPEDPSPMEVRRSLRDFITENFLFGDWNGFNEDTSFLESGIVDSTGMLEIINFLEETYGITIEDDELVPENFDSLNQLGAFLARKLREQPEDEPSGR